MKPVVILWVFSLFIAACSTSRSTTKRSSGDYDAALADSVLAYALDHEALYTLADTLKPISSVKFLRYAVAKDSTMTDGDAVVTDKDSLLQTIERYQKVCAALSTGDWQFVMMPFNRTEKNIRNMEIYVVRRSMFQKELAEHPGFWGQWGFTPSADPSVVLPVIEYETKWDRNRAYGYLFGYPDHAVNFFVEAQKTQDKDTARKLVPRDFFAIPVYAGNKGHFTYAIPKGYQPTTVDSSIYHRAAATLERYKTIRDKYKTATGIKARRLWKEMQRRQ
jgi:hemoglobin-like flavoprotein